jgi:DNA-binding HxlR family transcriptional regulator
VAAVESCDQIALACDQGLARAFDLLGKRWNGILLGSLTAGSASFSELSRAVAGISDSVLSERLAELSRARLVARSVFPGPPVSVTYRLTRAGHALVPALQELARWGHENLPAADCPSSTAAPTG